MAEDGRGVIPTATLEIRGLVLRLGLGILDEERLCERDVPVDLAWSGPHRGGAPFDYSEVVRAASSLQGSGFDLVEDVAGALLDLLRTRFPSGSWKVTVRKPWPPVEPRAECVSFTLEGRGDV